MLGIENLKKLINVGLSVPKQIAESSADGWQFTDAFSFVDEATAVIGVAKSWKDIAAELKDLTEEETAELTNHFKEKFDLPNDKVELFIEDALAQAVALVSLVQRFKDLKK